MVTIIETVYIDETGPYIDKRAADGSEVSFVFIDWLSDAETLVSVERTFPAGITVSAGTINTVQNIVNGRTIPVGKMASIVFSGGTASQEYSGTIKFNSSVSPRAKEITFRVKVK